MRVFSICLAVITALLSFAIARPTMAAGDPERGKKEFLKCVICHSAKPNVHKTGPSLGRIWGRRAGTVQGFSRYSKALQEAKVIWSEATLDAWLLDPQQFIPGNRMTMRGIRNGQRRQDLIAYLKVLAAQETDLSEEAAPGQGIVSGNPSSPEMPNLKLLAPNNRVKAIRYCGDTYRVTTVVGEILPFWEFNLRFKTDSSEYGPSKGRPVLLSASMQGDRAFVIFAHPGEISAFIKAKC